MTDEKNPAGPVSAPTPEEPLGQTYHRGPVIMRGPIDPRRHDHRQPPRPGGLHGLAAHGSVARAAHPGGVR